MQIMDLPHRSAIHNFHEPTYDRINTTRYRYCPFGSTPKDPIDYTRMCIKCRWTLEQASMALNQITLDAGGLIATGEPITYRTQYGWAPWITNMHQPLKNQLLSAYQHKVVLWSGERNTYIANVGIIAWIRRFYHPPSAICERTVIQIIWPITADADALHRSVRNACLVDLCHQWRQAKDGLIVSEQPHADQMIEGKMHRYVIGRGVKIDEINWEEGFTRRMSLPITHPGDHFEETQALPVQPPIINQPRPDSETERSDSVIDDTPCCG